MRVTGGGGGGGRGGDVMSVCTTAYTCVYVGGARTCVLVRGVRGVRGAHGVCCVCSVCMNVRVHDRNHIYVYLCGMCACGHAEERESAAAVRQETSKVDMEGRWTPDHSGSGSRSHGLYAMLAALPRSARPLWWEYCRPTQCRQPGG